MSEEGKVFLEAIFTSRMKYPKRKAKVAKFSLPESKWVRFPVLDSVVKESSQRKQDQKALI